MTAINVLLLPDAVHVFSDGGHHQGDVLRYIAPKAYALPRLNAVFAWSGVSAHAGDVLAAVDVAAPASLQQLVRMAPGIMAGLNFAEPFSAFFAGVEGGASIGVVVERKLSGEIVTHALGPWSVVTALKTEIEFDPANLQRSAIRMMEDQRARHRVVAGFIQHHAVSAAGIRMAYLHRWNDIVAGGARLQTHAAKIADLTVGTLKFAPNATIAVQIASVSSGSSITVTNEESLPVIFTLSGSWSYTSSSSSSSASFVYRLTRTRGSLIVATGGARKSGHTTASGILSSSGIDVDAEAGDQYTISYTYYASGTGSMSFASGRLKVVSNKR